MNKFKLGSIIVTSTMGVTIVVPPIAIAAVESTLKPIHDKSVYFKTPAIADTITVIDLSRFDEDRKEDEEDLKDDMNTTFQSLEGLIVQQKQRAEIFVKSGVGQRDRWLYDMQDKYHFKINVISNVKHVDGQQDIWDVLEKYKDLFQSQYIQYDKADAKAQPFTPERENISINNATMVSACDHYLMVSDKLIDRYGKEFEKIGITKATGAWDPTTNSVIQTFNHYKDQLNKTMLLNQDPVDFALRDYAIAAKIPTVCVGLEKEHRDEIAAQMKPNSPMFGWSHGFDGEMPGLGGEQPYLIWATQHKLNVLASDHCYNLSFYSYDSTNKIYRQHKQKRIKANPKKHYLAIVMSDGDNIQWMQNDFLTSEEYWGNQYRGDFPLSWTISPTPIDLNNSILERLYATATDNDEIIAGPSGYSYINPAWYYQDHLMNDYNEFAKRTAGYMHDCDLSVVNALDFQNPDYPDKPTDPKCMTPFMQQEQVKGIVWSLDGLSLDGHGSVNWINDKPLLSFREGIWDNDELRQVDILNRLRNVYPRDIHSIDGYTALVVNVWGPEGKMYKINEFVKQLPEDVELVTISQLLQLISDNVPHKDATPKDYPIR